MFTDADTYLEAPQTIQHALNTFRAQPDLLAVAGALTFEIDPTDEEGALLAANLDRIKLSTLWYTFLRAIERGHARYEPMKFLGPCMIMRAAEAAASGGFCTEDRIATDVLFGDGLKSFAATHNLRVEHGRDFGIGVINALRWSGRTRNTTMHQGFQLATNPGVMLVEPTGLENMPKQPAELTPELLQKLGTIVCKLPGGPEYVDVMLHRSFIVQARIAQPAPSPGTTSFQVA